MSESINKISFSQRLKNYRRHPFSFVMFLLPVIAAAVTVALLLSVVLYILIKGIPNFRPGLFQWKYTTRNPSMLPAVINTIVMTLLALVFAIPAGLGAAIFLVEYAKPGSRLVKIVRLTAETLTGIPSIVYGLFGYLMFVVYLGLGFSLLGGALTLAMMILPLIMRTTEEALKSVPALYREGSFGLGAGKLRTIVRIILPSAMPGILAGVILAVGRITGETAALVYTAGTVANTYLTDASLAGIYRSFFNSGRTLAVHMYSLMSEGLYSKEANATAVILLVMVFGLNALSGFIAKKLGNKH